MKKNKLIILADWASPKEKTWSGTTWSLTQALSKYYDVEIRDLDLPGWLLKIDNYAKLPIVGSLLGIIYDMLLRLRANKVIGPDKTIPVFEICIDVQVDNPYFTYQDMSYSGGLYVKSLQNKYHFLWEAAGNNRYSKTELLRRVKRQKKEYQNSQASLWMGKWIYEYMKTEFPSLSDKFYHIGGGTNMDVNKVDVSKKFGNKFLFVGRDYKRKAGDLVLDAFKIVREKYMPNAELHIAGPKEQSFESVDGVYFYGDIDYAKVGELMNICDVFCMPSRFEAYGLVFVESLIYGLPNVARNFFEMPYFIKEGKDGYLITNDDPTKYADLMYKAISNHDLINSVQSHREEYIKEYSWDSVALRAKNIIDSKMGFES